MHAAHELDGLRYIESVSKLCCASTTPLPSDVYEKLLQILEHHEDHHHLCHLSLEAYALLTRLTAQYPCVTLSTEKLDGKKHIVVDPKAWTPLSLHRKLEDAEKEDIAEEEEEEEEEEKKTRMNGNLTRKRARNRGAAWQTYTEKIEKLLELFKSIERDAAAAMDAKAKKQNEEEKEEEEEEVFFQSRAGTVLGFKYLTQIMAEDLNVRREVSSHYHMFVRKEGNLKYESLLPQLKHLLQSSVLCQLIRLTHQSVDGGNNMISLKSFVHKILQVKLLAARCMKGELIEAQQEQLLRCRGMTPELCREIYSVCKRLLNMICCLFSEMEKCVDFSGLSYGHVENDRKVLDTWIADFFFTGQTMESTWDRNNLLQTFEDPKYKLRFIGELFARYIGKQSSVDDHLVTLKHAVIQKDSLSLAPCVDEDEILEYIKLHPKNTIICLELVDTVVLILVHIYHAKLRIRQEEEREEAPFDPSKCRKQRSPQTGEENLLTSFIQVVECVREKAHSTTTATAGSKKEKGGVYQLSQYALTQLAFCHGVLQRAFPSAEP